MALLSVALVSCVTHRGRLTSIVESAVKEHCLVEALHSDAWVPQLEGRWDDTTAGEATDG